MSMFNTQEICMACSDAERQDPRYQEARAADEQAIRTGNYNFAGIGRWKTVRCFARARPDLAGLRT
jgi:hypothetical protein